MPNGQVTITATFVETEAPVGEPFLDVNEGDWFYDAVAYAYENGLMDGVGGNRFAPNSATTRAQLVTILYRMEGQPAVSGDLPFTDVEAGTWYTNAVVWAAQNGIVNGVGDDTFAPGGHPGALPPHRRAGHLDRRPGRGGAELCAGPGPAQTDHSFPRALARPGGRTRRLIFALPALSVRINLKKQRPARDRHGPSRALLSYAFRRR